MDSGEYGVNFNLILLQNLESTRTTYSVLSDTKELNETIYNLCESYWSRWDKWNSDEEKEIKEKEKRKRLQEGFNFKEMLGLKQKEEKRGVDSTLNTSVFSSKALWLNLTFLVL